MYTHPSFHSLVHLKSLCLAFQFHSYQHTSTHQRMGSTEQHRILHLVCKTAQIFHWLVFPSIQVLPDAPFGTWSGRLRTNINKNFINVTGNYDKNLSPKIRTVAHPLAHIWAFLIFLSWVFLVRTCQHTSRRKCVQDIELDCNLHRHRISASTTMNHLFLQTGLVSSLKPLVVAFLCHVLFDMLSSHLPSISAYYLLP